ncbi:sulfite exporter TauE/SafE family protein [Bacillus sp. ISL-40]|uniref:urease accessory protein UreH domain-containing protein n=1 Tax=unclassified Bacillus (in: firmicutes) TaxID=185979 RepID=UPI001BE91633|nr:MULTISPECIES: sulfite exporter TauE/SafE family protein [unclassified Bacillus (in: firmicutes)]MBT2698155.1 sulfite exporter TauE/SafE family protein [Bacillus sp. ISL-40]MBT2742023.1 sulfite exporter TauE/SafE family protein [Bacillus sp. ISL-77]
MYSILSQFSSFVSKPFSNIAYSLESWPIVFAFILGLIGALAPCQLTGNISAVTLYGNHSIQKKIAWKDVIFFTLGKVVAFSLLGVLVWLLGRGFEQNLTLYFPWLRKIMGPLLIIVGLFMLGFIKLKGTLNLLKGSKEYKSENPFGSFMLGFSFSLAFCPTMFLLFFVTLMPVVMSSAYGFILPPIFAIGTAIPLLIFIFIIWYLGGSGVIMKKGRKFGMVTQRIAGILMLLLGIFDTLTYWSL